MEVGFLLNKLNHVYIFFKFCTYLDLGTLQTVVTKKLSTLSQSAVTTLGCVAVRHEFLVQATFQSDCSECAVAEVNYLDLVQCMRRSTGATFSVTL